MEISVKKDELLNGLQRIVGIVNPKPALPALSCIFLEAEDKRLFLTATDLELTIKAEVPCKTKRKGALLVPGKRFAGIIRELPDTEINIVKEKNEKTQITVGKIMFTLPGLKTEEFPILPKIKKGTILKMKQGGLKRMLKRTRFSVTYDETRAYLRGILFSLKKDSLVLVGTDTRRLAYVKKSYPSPVEMEIILPLKLIDELEKSLDGEDVEINISPNQIIFKTPNLLIISQLIEGQFPDYEATFPSKEGLKKVKVGRERLAAAVRRMNLLTTERHSSIRFDLLPQKIVVSINSPEAGEASEPIPVEYSGEKIAISFNPAYILDVLKNLEAENVIVGISDPLKPALIRPDTDEEYKYILMPVKTE